MTIPDNLAVVAIVVTIIGWPSTALLAYWFWLKSKRIERQLEAKDAASERVRKFLGGIAELRALVATDQPDRWVHEFLDKAPLFQAEFDKISSDFPAKKRESIQILVDKILRFSSRNQNHLNQNQQDVLATLGEFPNP